MNEHFHIYARNFIAGLHNRRSPFHRTHTGCVYMGDIKAIDAKHFCHRMRGTQHNKILCVYVLGSCRPS